MPDVKHKYMHKELPNFFTSYYTVNQVDKSKKNNLLTKW